jgi:hypothetical protein
MMPIRGGILGCLILAWAATAQTAPYVDQVQATQYGSFVRVTCGVHGNWLELASSTLELHASLDGGLTFPHKATTLHGVTGVILTAGKGRQIYWDAYNDLPEQASANTVIWVRVVSPGYTNDTPLPQATSLPFVLDTRLASLDGDADGLPDDHFDLDENGVRDVLEDLDEDGTPDAFEDQDGDGYPDAYRDLNGDGIGDGLQDLDSDGLPDFRRQDRLVYSTTHPYSSAWYFTRDFRAVWPEFHPDGPGFYWAIDQDPMTRLWTTDSYTTAREVAMTVPEDGQWYLHLAAAEGPGVVLTNSQVVFPFKVSTDTPEITSSSHPTLDTRTILQEFRADFTFPRHEGRWQLVKGDWRKRYDHTSLVFKNRLWILGGRDTIPWNDVWSTVDGEHWAPATSSAPWEARSGHTSAVFKGKLWVIGGVNRTGEKLSDVWHSTDGATWQRATDAPGWSPRSNHTTLVFDNKLWVIGGGSEDGLPLSDVWWSADGFSWTMATDDAAWAARQDHASVVFDTKMWVMGGASGLNDVWWSTDGASWTMATEHAGWSTHGGLAAVVRQGKLWVFGGGNGYHDAWFSSDGSRWYEYTSDAEWSGRSGHTVTLYNNQLWLLAGREHVFFNPDIIKNDVWKSYDGTAWTSVGRPAGWTARRSPAMAAFGDRLWLIGGYNGKWVSDVWNSEDGIQWKQVTARVPWYGGDGDAVTADGKLWFIGRDGINEAWWTVNGVDWHAAKSGADWGKDRFVLSYGNKLRVIGSLFGIIDGPFIWDWNGDAWSRTELNTAYSFLFASGLEFDNKMWVLGGRSVSSPSAAVPYVSSSTDGINWTLATDEPGWEARRSPKVFSYGDSIWLVGGTRDITNPVYYQEAWRSPNGVDWTELDDTMWKNAVVEARGITEFQGKMWALGGNSFTGGYQSEVWAYEEPQALAHGCIYVIDDETDTDPRDVGIVAHSLPVTVSGIEPGEHWFHASPLDALGNALPPVHYPFFMMEDAAPVVTSPTHPDPAEAYPLSSVTFEWHSDVLPGLTYLYDFDQSPDTAPATPTDEETIALCAEPGTWWFHVQSVEPSGNGSTVVHREVNVTPLPAITLRSSSHPIELQAYPNRSVQMEWDPIPGVTRYEFASGAGEVSLATASLFFSGSETDAMFSAPEPGSYTFVVRGKDACGQYTPEAAYHVVITDVALELTLAASSTAQRLQFDISDPYGFANGSPKFFAVFDNQPYTQPTSDSPWNSPTYEVLNPAPGLHYFHVRARDYWDNLSRTEHLAVYVGEALINLSPPSHEAVQSGSVSYTISYPNATSVSLDASDISLVTSGTATGTASVVNTGVPNERRITLSNISGDGQISILVAAATAQYGSLQAPPVNESIPFRVDNTPPALSISGPSATETLGEPVSYEITAEDIDPAYTLDVLDIEFNHTGTATGTKAVTPLGNGRWQVTISGFGGFGRLGISVRDSALRDIAGNWSLAAGPSATFKVGTYTLEVKVEGGGTTTPPAGAHLYSWGDEAAISASSEDGWQFAHWDIGGTLYLESQLTVAMVRNIQATAYFTNTAFHSADTDQDGSIALSELLRVIQLHNLNGYHCVGSDWPTEDGYMPGLEGDHLCPEHNSDYNPADWRINLSEMLRAVQFFATLSYHACPQDNTEDGFCPGNGGVN